MPDPSSAASPQQLIAIADALAAFSDALDSYIKKQPNLFAPEVLRLRETDAQIASQAATIARTAVEIEAADVLAALNDLQVQINSATATLAAITDSKTALDLVAGVLSVAASLATGNPLGTAQSVVSLVETLRNAISAAEG
jgi:multisubunit Na+/H+ antiporter MnhF subunit